MLAGGLTERLDSAEALARHLRALLERDTRLAGIHKKAGSLQLRTGEPGFAGLAKVICGQQLSVASARAIWSRFELLQGALRPQTYLLLEESAVRATGFSGGKYRTLRAVAEAAVTGDLDFETLARLPAADAIGRLTAIPGIGPWTAEIYLMFSLAHPDIFPAGDLALQKAVGHALGMESAPGARDLIGIAEAWAPHRHTAALLFWRYYAAMRDKEGFLL